MQVKTFQDLTVWRKAHAFVLAIYQETALFPKEEQYGLTAQLRRAAASVPTNIAEGHKRQSAKDYARFVNVAEASLEESKYQLILARDLKYLSGRRYAELLAVAEEIGKMLNGLYRSLMRRSDA